MPARKKKETTFRDASVEYALTYREVVDILRLLRESGRDESVELSVGGMHLKFRRGDASIVAPMGPARLPAPRSTEADAGSDERKQSRDASVTPAAGIVSAPMLGMFYRAPEPGAPPFVDVGSMVRKGDTIGLIEVMKLFSPVCTDVPGQVVEIMAENAALVEYGQALIRIEPQPA